MHGALPEDRSVEHCIIESESELVFAFWDFLIPNVIERRVSEQGPVSDSHDQEDGSFVVEQSRMLFTSRPKAVPLCISMAQSKIGLGWRT